MVPNFPALGSGGMPPMHPTILMSGCKKKSNFEKVSIDMNLMIDTPNTHLSGSKVETNVLNVLLMGGVINILSQREVLEEESLEDLVVRQSDTIEEHQQKPLPLTMNLVANIGINTRLGRIDS